MSASGLLLVLVLVFPALLLRAQGFVGAVPGDMGGLGSFGMGSSHSTSAPNAGESFAAEGVVIEPLSRIERLSIAESEFEGAHVVLKGFEERRLLGASIASRSGN